MSHLFFDPVRSVDELIESAASVIDQAWEVGTSISPLFSGDHDSLTACHLASQHSRFSGEVHHIDTGIGADAARQFVEETAVEMGWKLSIYKSECTYEQFIRERGFPGPGMHQWAYVRLKDRCVRKIVKGKKSVILLTGCRRFESVRRMGSVEPVKVGYIDKKGKVHEKNRVWTAPCFDWNTEEQQAYMNHFELPINPVKRTPLAMSGECFCGCFARPDERQMVNQFVPDVGEEIDRLTFIARKCKNHDEWGTRPPGDDGIVTAKTGPLCNSCDAKLAVCGVNLFSSTES